MVGDTERIVPERVNETLDQENKFLKKRVEDMDFLVGNLRDQTISLKKELEEKKSLFRQKFKQNNNLDFIIRESWQRIADIENSFSYRLGRALTFPIRFLFPVGSKREVFLKSFPAVIRHPLSFLKKLSFYNIERFFLALREENSTDISRNLANYLSNSPEAISVNSYKLDEIDFSCEYFFRQSENPKISIIIPVFNQYSYSYRCLKSILENSGDELYEVILADDCSTDDTLLIDQKFKNLKIVRNDQNLGFIKNCNKAANVARGDFLVFLNNDTYVKEGWLDCLLKTFEDREHVGIVGAKLIYPDGKLQEAGGIVWRDAIGLNYGNGDDPEKSEYNYIKEVDYVSGACFMIPRKIWKSLGGFDENFERAYYEDTDLSFRVREQGLKVIYQPKSEVIHFETVSHKKASLEFQEKNRKIFRKKWKDILETRHFKNCKEIYLARDRSRAKKTILVIDHYVPQQDRDAGSRSVFQYIKCFCEMGFNVKFLGDNFHRAEPYTSQLQLLGVEVLYGKYYADNWRKWIKENALYLDYVYLNRPNVARRYIDFIKNNTIARILYFGHDLHFLRMEREYDLTREHKTLKESERFKKLEMEIMEKSDVILTVSEKEKHLINKSLPEKFVSIIPLFVYDSFKEPIDNFNNRQGLLFVGGFQHPPNLDGVMWFLHEIYPLVLEKIPELKFYVVGSNIPDELINEQSENVVILSDLSDRELADVYFRVRMAVIPLRYGSGVKGKVIESLYYGLPIVSTSIGIEGIKDVSEVLSSHDTVKDFSGAIIEQYKNNDYLRKASFNNIQFVQKEYSTAFLENLILQLF